MKFLLFILVISKAFGHGRSQEMIETLNAPVPEWLSLGKPIRVEVIERGNQVANYGGFHDRSGGTKNTATRVQIPSRGIDIELSDNFDKIILKVGEGLVLAKVDLKSEPELLAARPLTQSNSREKNVEPDLEPGSLEKQSEGDSRGSVGWWLIALGLVCGLFFLFKKKAKK